MLRYRDMDDLASEAIVVQYNTDKKGIRKGYLIPKLKKTKVTVDGIEFDVSFSINSNRIKEMWKYEDIDSYRASLQSMLDDDASGEWELDEETRNLFIDALKMNDDELYVDLWHGNYDPNEALSCCSRPDGFTDDKSGMFITNPIAVERVDLEKISSLSPEQGLKRQHVFISVMQRVVTEEMAMTLVDRAQKKKNGTLYKGRILPIAYLNYVTKDGTVLQLVAKNEKDTTLKVELRCADVNTSFLENGDLLSSTDLFF